MAEYVEIFEVGPRDGLQNEPAEISVTDKVALVNQLSRAGFRRIECASFVSPKWVPQMAGSAEVLGQIHRANAVRYTALTPNMRGFDDAMLAGADEVAVFGSASEGFSKANINASVAESLERFAPVVAAAKDRNIPVRGYVSCVVECPYDGSVAPADTARVAKALYDMGCSEISLGDTIGQGRPDAVRAMLMAVKDVVPVEILAGHFHDTGGHALDNIDVSLEMGLRIFDAAVGGLGGCPYAPGAAGNVATEAVDARLKARGFETGLDAKAVEQAVIMARAMRKT
ncbi:MAG: hydroxymethylglutaryl-CoA lyase [Paracoccaceae bacterium]